MRKLRGYINSSVEARWNRTLSLQRLRTVPQNEWSK
jgi:hypothetical protein